MLEIVVLFVLGATGLVGGVGLTALWATMARENGIGTGWTRACAFSGLALFVVLVAGAVRVLMFAVERLSSGC